MAKSKDYERGKRLGAAMLKRNFKRFGDERGYEISRKACLTICKKRDSYPIIAKGKYSLYEGMGDEMSRRLTGDKTTHRERCERVMREDYPKDFYDDFD